MTVHRLDESELVQSKKHIQLAHDMAVQSFVLLKNNMDTGLPITKKYNSACVCLVLYNVCAWSDT